MTLFPTLRTTFNHHHLLLARLGWLAICLLIFSMITASLPHLYVDIRTEWQVGEARAAAMRLFSTHDAYLYTIITLRLITLSTFIFTAFFLAWRKWNDWFVLYISATLLMLGYFFGMDFNINVIRYPQWLAQNFPAIRALVPTLITINMVLFFYLFPNGRFTPRWLIWFTIPSILFILTFMGEAFYGGTPWTLLLESGLDWLLQALNLGADRWFHLFAATLIITIFIGLMSQLIRFHRTPSGIARQQIKWVILGLATIPLGPSLNLFFFYLLPGSYSTRQFISLISGIILPLAIPLTIAFSILRYRLWEVDIWINRTVVFGGLTLLITAVYILTVGLLSSLFQSDNSLALSIVATGLIAILFNPVRQRLQTAVNRLMYGQRDDPITVLAELGRRLEETAVPNETLPALVQIIAQTLKLPYVAIVTDEDDLVTAVGTEQGSLQTFALVYQSRTIGRLLVAPRQLHETFTADEEHLLRNVARQAGAAVYAYQLTNQLQRSRERLVTMREEERRRLRRDLHDGLGPQLAAVAVKVNAAQNLLHSEPDQAQTLLTEIKTEAQQAIQEIRRVVDGLRPPILDQLGLVSALREFVAQNSNGRVQITLHAPAALPPLPAAVEVAAYRIITEALTNAIRHAQAQSCQIHLTVNHGMMLEIHDNGCGLPSEPAYGVGLFSMQERAEELGGTFAIISEPGRGTRVMAHLPIMDDQNQ